MTKSALAIFEDFKIRRHYDEKTETWYFSIVDVIYALTESKNPRNYWKVLKHRLLKEGNQSVTNCNQLKLQSTDGKFYKTDVATPEQLLRLIQSIPSPKAEPFKLWLAKVGYERIQETADDFAMLTNVIHQEWSDLSVAQHKKLKGLEHQNLREHMSEAELLFTALAELSTRQIAEKDQAEGVQENKAAGHKGGKLAKQARLQFEEATGTKVVTSKSSLPDFTPKKQIKKK